MIRIVVADDHPVVRAGLVALLAGEADLAVVGQASSAEEAVTAAADLAPDVVLMDLQFGAGPTGAEATRRIRAEPAAPAVLVLTNYDTDADILGAVEAGASGYLLKDAPPEVLVAAVRAAAAGESALAPAVAARLLGRMQRPQVTLTPRETEVVGLVSDGLSNADIATRLFLTEATVKSHLVRVFTKLDVTSRTQAVAAARRLGLVRDRS
ncbi:response regulator transcription factor [Agilicoccus flavus]|uniref:response regulator transcription factor n=1 Tax=Agilicoccus flavus TaxID=2775968 RepID=UPI001CF6C53B|nr:response regulator transcription factor [Agilicoccus flavus]